MNSRPGDSAWESLDEIHYKLQQLDGGAASPASVQPKRTRRTLASVWEQRRTKSMQLRVNMAMAARAMGVYHLFDKDSANTILNNKQSREELMTKAAAGYKKRHTLPEQKRTRCLDLRRESALNKRQEIEDRQYFNSEEYIRENLMVHPHNPPPPETYDKEIVPKLTKTSAMRTGLNFQDLAVSLHTLKWATPPIRRDIPSREPYTKVSMKADKKFGNNWRMGVGARFEYPATFTGSPTGPNLDPPDLNDSAPFRKYHIRGRLEKKAILTGCGDNIGPGSYEADSMFVKKGLKQNFIMKVGGQLIRPRSGKEGTMISRCPRFEFPGTFKGNPRGPDYDPPGLIDKAPFRKYRINGRKNAPALLVGTTAAVGPGKYDLPPVFGCRPRSASSRPQTTNDHGHRPTSA